VLSWRRADYPAELARAGLQGPVTLHFSVDEGGHVGDAVVVQSFDPRANPAALADISQWRFQPALVGSRPALCRMTIDIFFGAKFALAPLPVVPTPAEMPHSVKKIDPRPLNTPRANYPPELLSQGASGVVRLILLIDKTGQVADSTLLDATDPAFAREATEVVRMWNFIPAHQDAQAVPALYSADMDFAP
jgi:TonB family protein